ncbi:pyridoxal phosphate-dependent transferase [Suillus cothurnatus]|nr:pyridoxal phosphate-dependent transferase [Suillus cothurnatus]
MSLQSLTCQLSGTHLVHGDRGPENEVAHSISVNSPFRNVSRGNPKGLGAIDHEKQVYSRYSQDVTSRVEQILSKVNQGYAATYASGLAAAFSALVHFKPKRIAISRGYMGYDEFQEGDLCWLESPLHPTGESRNIPYYADKVHAVGGKLLVDSTLGPPPLQYPFKWGAGTAYFTPYFAGHSDLFCGILVVRTEDEQSASGTEIVQWLSKAVVPEGKEFDGIPGGLITKVRHSSFRRLMLMGLTLGTNGRWIQCLFSILLSKEEYAEKLPHSLDHFHVPATSLGGVESLAQQQIRADPKEDPCLVYLSIGVEEVEDLKNDLRRALVEISKGI